MKKFLAILLAVILIVGVAACAAETVPVQQPAPAADPPAPAADPTPPPTPEPPAPPPEPPAPPPEPITEDVDIRIALVAHSPESIQFDGSFNEGAYNGIRQFMAAHNINPATNFQFFQALEATDAARLDQMESAIESFGADILVLPGFHFMSSLYHAQQWWPEANFILLDAVPAYDGNQRTDANLVAVLYAEEESGFLAGYAAVMDGYRQLGFMGGVAVPAVARFGHGFVQGAEYAAASLGLDAGEVSVRYHYLGGFAPDPAHTALASGWFAAGTEVIFAAAGGAGASVIAAAEAAGAYVIGVDVDQSGASPVVITSATKALANSVYNLLSHYAAGTFPGGRVELFNAAAQGVELPMATSRFREFTQAQYDAIFNQLATGAVVVNNSLDQDEVFADISLVTILTT